jgi:signal transduction histidine kinase/FixJ family two-component response regulator
VITGVTATAAAVVAVALSYQMYALVQPGSDAAERASFTDIAASAVLFALVAVVVGTLLGWQLGRLVTRPVLRMANAMERMAEGDLAVRTPPSHPATEIGRMARAFERFRNVAHELIASEAGRQAAEKAARDRSEFLAVISHEIRTPMNGVLGMAEALQHTGLNPRQAEMVSVLSSSGRALMHLLNDVIDFAKIEAGRFEIASAAFPVRSVIESAAELFRVEAVGKGVELRFTMSGPDLSLIGDGPRIRQIVQNLVSNAVKFTARGTVEVRVELDASDVAAKLAVAVTDTGIGMSEAVQARLFEKFVQGDTSSTREYGGAGLGLAISKELAGLMGGRIVASSRLGEGSCFTLTLALPVAAEVSAEPAPASTRADGLRVLVAEDNAMNRTVLGLLLTQSNAVVTYAADGVECVEAWIADRPDIVLMDLHMPRMDGVAAAEEIRRLEMASGLVRTPIVACTADAAPATVARCMTAGMDGHVSKPIRPAVLMAAIHTALEGAGQAHSAAAPAEEAAA